MFRNLRIRQRQKKEKAVPEKRLGELIRDELTSYIKREDLQEYLDRIERDKRKKELWDALPAHKKLKLLRYALEKKGGKRGKAKK